MFLIIYNQKAGHAAKDSLNNLILEIEHHGYLVSNLSITDDCFQERLYSLLPKVSWLISFGGDGTLNTVVNYLAPLEDQLPPVIPYPSGTANDFSRHLYGKEIDASDIMSNLENNSTNTMFLDVAKANESYFINVLGTGLFADVAYQADPELKQKIGMWAYWFAALKRITQYKPISFFISENQSTQENQIEGYLLLALNGRGAGGFPNLAPDSSLRDGLLDVVILKESSSLLSLATLFPKILNGHHIEDHRVTYFQTDELYLNTSENDMISVIDGEVGPSFPLHIKVIKQKLPFVCI